MAEEESVEEQIDPVKLNQGLMHQIAVKKEAEARLEALKEDLKDLYSDGDIVDVKKKIKQARKDLKAANEGISKQHTALRGAIENNEHHKLDFSLTLDDFN